MTKEELLSKLKEMAENLKYDKATSITADNREKELKNIEKQRELLKLQARELEIKLSNDENYQDFSYIKNQSKIYDYNSRIDKINEELLQNETNKQNNNNRIDYINREISACNALLSEAQKRLEQYGYELRSLGENPTPEQDKEVMSKLASAREDIGYLKSEMELYNTELADLTANNEELNRRANTLGNSKDRYIKLLDSVQTRENKAKNNIDQAKKDKDKIKLLQMQGAIDAFNNREEFISFDFPIELESLIYEIENNKIDNSTIMARLNELKEKMPEKLLNKDYKDAEQELAENRKAQADILMEKLALEEKLSNPDNYLPSIFAVEVMNSEITNLETSIAKYETDIKAIDSNLIQYENNRKDYETTIENEQKNKERLNDELSQIRLKEAILPTEIYEQQKDDLAKEKKRIQKEIIDTDKKIEKLNKAILTIDLMATSAKKCKKNFEMLRNSEIKNLETKQKSLDERSGVNKLLMADDKIKLETLIGQLNMLKMRENAIYYDYETALGDIMTNFSKDAEYKKGGNPIVPPIAPQIDSDSKDKEEEKDSDPIVPPVVPPINPDSKDKEEEKDSDPIVPPIVPPINPDSKDKEEKAIAPVDGEKAAEEEKDKPIPISFWKKAKNKLLEKIKDKKFMRRLKAALAAVVVALTLGMGLSRCSNGDSQKGLSPEIMDLVKDPVLPDDDLGDLSDLDDEIENDLDDNNQIQNQPESNSNQTPEPDPAPTPKPDPTPTPKPDPTPTPEPDPTPTPEPDPTPTPKPDPTPTPKPDPTPTPEPDPTPTPEPDPTPTPEPDPTPTPETSTMEVYTPEDSITISGYQDANGEDQALVVDNLTSNGDLTPEDERLAQEVQNITDYIQNQDFGVTDVYENPDVTEHTYDSDGGTTTTVETGNYETDKSLADMIKEYYGVSETNQENEPEMERTKR